MLQKTITDVFFDLDHTLWDFEKNSALTFEILFEKHHINLDLQEFLKHYVPINIKYWEMYRKDEITQSELRYGRLKETFDLVNYQTSDELIAFISHEYIQYLPTFSNLFEGTIEILEYLKPKYKLHIITNGFEEVQNKKMNSSGITHYFETITNSEKSGAKKPNPIIFEHAMTVANAQKQTSIMIGDCIDADVRGALDFGLKAIWFTQNPAQNQENVTQISHLLELKKYL